MEALDEAVVKALNETEVGVPNVVEVHALGEEEVGFEQLLHWYSSASRGRQQ